MPCRLICLCVGLVGFLRILPMLLSGLLLPLEGNLEESSLLWSFCTVMLNDIVFELLRLLLMSVDLYLCTRLIGYSQSSK